ncbi:MAG: hypothetical protein Q8920_05355 [Bacillota bacterium]|nr:hypothetical protein [Bacillota bacterium]
MKLLLDGLTDNEFSGQILIAMDGDILYNNCFGMADYKTGRKIDSNTTFSLRTASMIFTTAAIMLLAVMDFSRTHF